MDVKDVVAETPVVTDVPVVVKKKPGRPPKAQPVKQTIEGVSTTPKIEGNVIEILHSSSALFKKIFTSFKSFSVSDIKIKFYPTGARLIATDHTKKSHIFVIVYGTQIERYFCKEPITFIVTCSDIYEVMSNIEKNSTNIAFMISEDNKSLMNVFIRDSEYNSDHKYEVSIKHVIDDDVEMEDNPYYPFNDADYPIGFEFSLKGFKSLLTKLSKNGDEFSLQKIGTSVENPLQFVSGKKKLTAPYDDDKIKLKNNLGPNDTFSVSMMIEQIKPIFVTGISEKIDIAADSTRHMSFTTRLEADKDRFTATMKVFSETKSIKAK